MKTTLAILDPLYRQIKRRATERRQSISHTVAEILDASRRVAAGRPGTKPTPLPVFAGKLLVNVANRRVLYDAMDRSAGMNQPR